MKPVLSIIIFFLIFQAYGQIAPLNWGYSFHGSAGFNGTSLASDKKGHIITALSFKGTCTFAGQVLQSGATYYKTLLVKYDSTGQVVWSISLNGDNFAYIKSIWVDAENNIFLAGIYRGNMTLGGTTLTNPGDNNNVFCAKLTAAGNWCWVRFWGGVSHTSVNALTGNHHGELAVTGSFTQAFNLGSTVLIPHEQTADMYVAKLDTSGLILWAKGMGGNGYDEGADIAISEEGKCIATGYFEYSFTVGNSTLIEHPGQNYDRFSIFYNADGVQKWARRFGNNNNDGINRCRFLSDETLLVGGTVSASFQMGNFTISPLSGLGAFLARMDTNGNGQWAKAFPGNGIEQLAVNPQGNYIFTGEYAPPIQQGPFTLNSNLGGSEDFLSILSAEGNFLSAQSINTVNLRPFPKFCTVGTDGVGLMCNFSQIFSINDTTLSPFTLSNCFFGLFGHPNITPLSVSGNISSENLPVWPNPWESGPLTVNTEQGGVIRLFNAAGQDVFSQYLPAGLQQINRKFPPGLYRLRLQNSYTRKSKMLLIR